MIWLCNSNSNRISIARISKSRSGPQLQTLFLCAADPDQTLVKTDMQTTYVIMGQHSIRMQMWQALWMLRKWWDKSQRPTKHPWCKTKTCKSWLDNLRTRTQVVWTHRLGWWFDKVMSRSATIQLTFLALINSNPNVSQRIRPRSAIYVNVCSSWIKVQLFHHNSCLSQIQLTMNWQTQTNTLTLW